MQVTFWNVQQLMDVKRELMPALRRNRAKAATRDAYSAFAPGDASRAARSLQVGISLFCGGFRGSRHSASPL